MSLDLSLSVQYGTDAPQLPRWRLRRWVERTLAGLEAVRRQEPPGDTGMVALAPALARVALGIRLVDADEGRELNRDYRHKDYATNVLTFEYGLAPDGTASADVVLCVPVLHREAAEQGKPLLHHAAHLVVHGVLHSLGYDHLEPDEAERMEALETRILGGMGIPDPYAA